MSKPFMIEEGEIYADPRGNKIRIEKTIDNTHQRLFESDAGVIYTEDGSPIVTKEDCPKVGALRKIPAFKRVMIVRLDDGFLALSLLHRDGMEYVSSINLLFHETPKELEGQDVAEDNLHFSLRPYREAVNMGAVVPLLIIPLVLTGPLNGRRFFSHKSNDRHSSVMDISGYMYPMSENRRSYANSLSDADDLVLVIYRDAVSM